MIPPDQPDALPHSSGTGPQRMVPDLKQCRARLAGFGDYVDCLRDRPERCMFSLPFGRGHLCLHDRRWAIATGTLDTNPTPLKQGEARRRQSESTNRHGANPNPSSGAVQA